MLYIFFSNTVSDIVFTAAEIIMPSAAMSGELYLNEVTVEIINVLVYLISLLPPIFIHMVIVGIPPRAALPFRSIKSDMAAGGIFIGLGMMTVATYLTGWFGAALQGFGIEATQPGTCIPETFAGRIAFFIATAVLPAFIEEMFLRGAVMQSMRPFGDTFALIFSALIFGMLHMNFVQMPYAFIMALCIGYFVMRSGSLWVGVIVHLVNNGVATLVEFVTEDFGFSAGYTVNMVIDVLLIVSGFIVLFLLMKDHTDLFLLEHYRGVFGTLEKVKHFASAPVFIAAAVIMLFKSLKYLSFIWR